MGDELDEGVGDEEGGEAEGTVLEESETVAPADDAEAEDDGGDLPGAAVAEAPKDAWDSEALEEAVHPADHLLVAREVEGHPLQRAEPVPIHHK
eukprot:COSAG04_NODE_1266_length_7481_cov_4.293552_2_plen_94_part_00